MKLEEPLCYCRLKENVHFCFNRINLPLYEEDLVVVVAGVRLIWISVFDDCFWAGFLVEFKVESVVLDCTSIIDFSLLLLLFSDSIVCLL